MRGPSTMSFLRMEKQRFRISLNLATHKISSTRDDFACRISAALSGRQGVQNFCNIMGQTFQNFCSIGLKTLQIFCIIGRHIMQNFCSNEHKKTLQNFCIIRHYNGRQDVQNFCTLETLNLEFLQHWTSYLAEFLQGMKLKKKRITILFSVELYKMLLF